MIGDDKIFQVDLQAKRKAIRPKVTQNDLAEEWGVKRVTLARVESRERPISFQMAIHGARKFGSVRVESGGDVFEVRRVGTSDYESRRDGHANTADIPEDGLDADDLIARSGVEAAQVSEKARQLGENIVAMRMGTQRGRAFRVGLIKEALEAFLWLAAFRRRARLEYPDDYEIAAERVRSGLADEFGDMAMERELQVA